MDGLRNIAIRWYRDVFGAPAGSDIREEGLECVLDGNSAVALSEASISSHAVLGGSFPSAQADAVWLAELEHDGTNLFGEALSAQTTEGPRGIIAAATGLALTGRRATAFLSGTDIAAAQDLMISAAGKHVPLVLHIGTRSATAHGTTLGSGHDTVHLSADAGFFMLFAANVQEAVDFTYIARRVAEESLVPGMVVMDGEQTALATQDVRLLSPAQINDFIGAAREQIEAPTAAQKLLFGEMRRRVPAWHDLDEPVLTGALFEKESFALGALARGPFFDAFVERIVRNFRAQDRQTVRGHLSLQARRCEDGTDCTGRRRRNGASSSGLPAQATQGQGWSTRHSCAAALPGSPNRQCTRGAGLCVRPRTHCCSDVWRAATDPRNSRQHGSSR